MAKGKKTGGRRAGSSNKVTKVAHEAIDLAFAGVGGVEALTKWGKDNQTEFYKLWAKRIPNTTEHSGPDGGPIQHWVFGGKKVQF